MARTHYAALPPLPEPCKAGEFTHDTPVFSWKQIQDYGFACLQAQAAEDDQEREQEGKEKRW